MSRLRLGALALGVLLTLAGFGADADAKRNAAARSSSGEADALRFDHFVTALRPDAEAAGIAGPVFDATFRGMAPDPKVEALAARQSEFSRPIGDYVEASVSAKRLARGRELGERWASVLDAVERRDGVPREIVLALWAMESDFGASTGGFSTLRSLATLASRGGARGPYFRGELIDALRILSRERSTPEQLTGSWAGAMGQTQFMPSSFLAVAVDQDGDGRRDIWTSVPDVLGSIANFMATSGWKAGLPWGFEVVLPHDVDLRVHARGFGAWASLGVARADGAALPSSGDGRLFLPAGIAGPAFLLSDNFEAIRAYNTSDSYALAVGRLADRLGGGGPLRRPWPKAKVLDIAERREVHRRLAALGFYDGTPDGKFGAQTRDAVRRFQISLGMVPDGYADEAVLKALRSR